MGYSTDATGYPTFDDNVDLPADLQAGPAYARATGGLLKGTSTERTNLTASQVSVGWLFAESDTGALYVRRPEGWEAVHRPAHRRFVRATGSDAAVSSGTYIGLVEGTIADARAGTYMVIARASLYASAGAPVVGRVYAESQSEGAVSPSREEARWDLPNVGSYPVSATVQAMVVHPGGDLRVAAGYRRDAGTFAVTGQGSGETVVTATYLGPGS
jgi:hypothetical protein